MAAWPNKYGRSALIVFSSNNLIGANDYNPANDLILTDHGRSEFSFSPQRVETAERMIDGTYRSHYVTEKREFSFSYSDVPSRSLHTADTYAGGNEIVNYLKAKAGTFYLKLTRDTATGSGATSAQPEEVYKVMVKGYSHATSRRSGKFDMMNIEVTLVEV
jgi:hypothetical protein